MEALEKMQCCICALAACLALACMVSPAALAAPRTGDDNSTKSCGDAAAPRILIAYDTIHGSTGEVAVRIGEVLCGRGFAADVKWVGDVAGVEGYDGFIVGSALYQFTWLGEAKKFLQTNYGQLAAKPTAVFVVGASMSQDTPKTREMVRKAFVQPVLKKYPAITPLSVGLFGGAFDFDKEQYTLFEKIVLRILGFVLRLPDRRKADWRNWDTIDAWADEVAGKLQ